MVDSFVTLQCPSEPPDLVGSWTGTWEEIRFISGELVMYSLDVYFPMMHCASPVWVRTFQRETKDQCIEAFGEWLDSILTCDTIYPD